MTRAAKDRAEKVVRQHKTKKDNWRARQYVFSKELLFMSSSIVFFSGF